MQGLTLRTAKVNGELIISRDSLVAYLLLSAENFGYGQTGNASRDTLIFLAKTLKDLK